MTDWPMTPPETTRPRAETRQVARVLAATFGILFLLIFFLIAVAS
jgi:hypothetical protein